MEKLQTHSSVTLGTQHGPTSWSALWAFPQTGRDTGGKPTLVPILMELPDMAEEEIDVQEACDAGLVDREDLVDELSKQVGYVCVCFMIYLRCCCLSYSVSQIALPLSIWQSEKLQCQWQAMPPSLQPAMGFVSFNILPLLYRVMLYQSVQGMNCCYLAAAHVEYTVYTIDIWRTDVLDAIMEVDGNCNIKQANKDASTMFGFPVAGMKTLNLSRLFHLAGADHCWLQTAWLLMHTGTSDRKLLCTLLCVLSVFVTRHKTAGLARIVPACGDVALRWSKQHIFGLIKHQLQRFAAWQDAHCQLGCRCCAEGWSACWQAACGGLPGHQEDPAQGSQGRGCD